MSFDLDLYVRSFPQSSDELREQRLSDTFIKRMERLRVLVTHWSQFPMKFPREIVQFDQDHFGVQHTQAYSDIAIVQALIGKMQATTKDFARVKANEMILRDMEAARRDGDWRAVASMQKNYITNNKTDKDDPMELEFDKIIPQQFEMTDDITIVIPGAQKISPKRRAEIIKKYGGKPTDIEDADFEEMK